MRLLLVALALAQAPIADVLVALELPVAARDLRAAGVSPAEAAGVLGAAREHGLGPADATRLVLALEAAVRAHGVAPNLAGAVKARLAAGLRGEVLHAAVAEDVAKGGGAPAAPKAAAHGGHE